MANRGMLLTVQSSSSWVLEFSEKNTGLKKHRTSFYCLERKVHSEPLGSREQSLTFLSLHNGDRFFSLWSRFLCVSLSEEKNISIILLVKIPLLKVKRYFSAKVFCSLPLWWGLSSIGYSWWSFQSSPLKPYTDQSLSSIIKENIKKRKHSK